jgi:hypothetical protein
MGFTRTVGVFLLIGSLVGGCGERQVPPRPDTSPTAADSICPSSTVRDTVAYCTALFDGDRALRLPADPSDGRRYGAVKRNGAAFHTAAGDLEIATGLRSRLGIESHDNHEEHTGYPNTVYLATVDDGTVTAVQPVAVVTEDLLLSTVFGGRALEGTIGVRTGPQTYSFTRTLPIRLELRAAASDGRLAGRIVNATAAVRGSTGGCLAALTATAGNPLVGNFTADVQIERAPSMHVEFGDELVLNWAEGSNMGAEFYPSVATLLGVDPLAGSWTAGLHGNPINGPELVLHTVTGGGGPC